MDIGEFKSYKTKLEGDIRFAISKCMEDFTLVTGYSPNRIDVEIVDISPLSANPNKFYTVSNVSTEVKI